MDIYLNGDIMSMKQTKLRPSASYVIRKFKWQIMDVFL